MDFYYLIESAPCRAVLMTAQALRIELNKKPLDLKRGEHLTPHFLQINPQHTTPTLVDDGFVLWESRAIMIYLVEQYGSGEMPLYPKCPQKRALINQRLYFDLSLYPVFRAYYYPQVIDKLPPNAEALEKLETKLECLNRFLEQQTYMAGKTLTLADITLLATISTFVVSDIDLAKYSNLLKWYEHCKKVVPGFDENWRGCLAFKEYY